MKNKVIRGIGMGFLISSLLLPVNANVVNAGKLRPLNQEENMEKNIGNNKKIDNKRKTGIISPKQATGEDKNALQKQSNDIKNKNENKVQDDNELNKLKVVNRYKQKDSVLESPVYKEGRFEKQKNKHIERYVGKSGPISPINMNQIGVRISSRFGSRKAPNQWASTFHRGVDIAAPTGTLIYSPLAGEVTMVKHTGTGGNTIKIRHSEGRESVFMHMSMRAVQVGDKVEKGQIIGTVGNTGNSTGSHLHYEFRHNGIAINPINIIMQ